MPLPDMLIFSCRPELETAFRALEVLFGVAGAVDIDVDGNARVSSVVRSEIRFVVVVGEGAIGGVGRSSNSEVRAARNTQCSSRHRVDGQWREPVGRDLVVIGGCARIDSQRSKVRCQADRLGVDETRCGAGANLAKPASMLGRRHEGATVEISRRGGCRPQIDGKVCCVDVEDYIAVALLACLRYSPSWVNSVVGPL
jgi:hypothetical protein